MTAIATQTINLDLRPHFNRQNNCIVYCSQYDNDLRNVVVNIADAGTAVNVSTYTIYIEGTKPDKKGFSYELTDIGGTVSNNVVTFPLQLQMTACAGITNAELVFYSGDDRVGSSNFILAVEKAGLADDIDVSETDIPAYVDGAQQAAAAAAQSADDAEDAKDTAVSAAETAQGVLESIPEDYSDLSNDVDDLKNAFEQLPTSIQPDMSVGNVFSDDSYTSDRTPYLYRVSGGGVEVGKVEADTIVGGTIAWNQLYPIHNAFYVASGSIEGLTIDVTNGYINITGTATADAKVQIRPDTVQVPAGHVCLMLCDGWNGFRWSRNGFQSRGAYDYFINKHSVDFSAMAHVELYAGTTYNIHARFSSYDLTQMFGSTVADYLYSLETATAGAGVAVFRKMFPNAYYEYNAGELLSVSGVSEHVMTGFNQWDEQWELGGISNATGAVYGANDRIRSKNFISCLPNTAYYFKTPAVLGTIAYYDADKVFISALSNDAGNTTRTTPSNAYFIKFCTTNIYGNVYNHDICINLSWDGERNGEYEPYEVHSYPLDSSLTLRGIPKLDSANNLYYDGDVYSADGKVQRKYGVVDLGSLTWEAWTGYAGVFRTSLPSNCKTMPNNNTLPNWVSTYNVAIGTDIAGNNGTIGQLHQTYLVVHDDRYSTATDFKNAVTGKALVYELATPTEETAQPYTEYQKVSKYGTEEYVSTGIVPVGHVTKYLTDIVSKVDGLPSDFSTLIAPTEKGFTATRAYSVNQFMIINNQLYKATASIANGATITVGTNVTATTIADILTSLLNA